MVTSLNNRFCDLKDAFSDRKNSRFLVLPIPYEATISYGKGTGNGPNAIINASTNIELYDEELHQETHKHGIHTLPPMEFSSASHKDVINDLRKYTLDAIEQNKTLISLGGEHSLSIGLVQAFSEKYRKLSVLYLDAHADLRDSYRNNSYSHACAARRILDFAPLVSAGTRSLSAEEAEFIKKNDLKIFWEKNAINNTKKIIDFLSDTVYISIDLDIMDPSIMSSTGTPEPDGWLWKELTSFLKIIISRKKIVGLDIVELAPVKNMPSPDFTAAKLIYRLMGYISLNTEVH